jgi:hypothetical protein
MTTTTSILVLVGCFRVALAALAPLLRVARRMRVHPAKMSLVELALETPLALVSWALRRRLRAMGAREAGYARPRMHWDPLYATRLMSSAPYLERQLVVSPRWNTAGLLGLVTVSHERPFGGVVLRMPAAASGQRRWSVVAYAVDDARTLGWADGEAAGECTRLTLARGVVAVRLSVRVYPDDSGDGTVTFPEVSLVGDEWGPDLRPVVEAAAIPRESFFDDWARLPRTRLAQALHWHAYTMLCWQGRLFSDATMRAMMLPVGNPTTRYAYGPVSAGVPLSFRVPDAAWDAVLVCYVTVYDRCSLPVQTLRLTRGAPRARASCEADGFYLARGVSAGASEGGAVAAALALAAGGENNPTRGGLQLRLEVSSE